MTARPGSIPPIPVASDRMSPFRRTLVLTLAMAAAGAVLGYVRLRHGAPAGPVTLTWWELAPAVVLAEALGFHLEVRGEAHTFTLTEVPLVIGCFFAAPWAVVLARLLGGCLFQVGRRRQRGLKLAFNVSSWFLESTAVLTLIRLVIHFRPPTDPVSWSLIVASVVFADALSVLAVLNVIRWHGGQPRTSAVAIAGGMTVLVNVTLALLAALLLLDEPSALALLSIVLVSTAVAYRGYANLSKRYASLKLLYDFTRVIGVSMTAESVLHELLGKARDVLQAQIAEVVLFDRVTERPVMRQRNAEGDPRMGVVPVDANDVGASWSETVRDGATIHVSRTEKDTWRAELRERLRVHDLVVAPLRLDGTVTGAIMVANRLGNLSTFDEDDARLFETLANHASVALENSRLVEQLRNEAEERRLEALHDALTGLPNRALFSQRLEASLAEEGHVAVILMDLDGFKEVNDTLGHQAGDVLLQEVARRLTDHLRSCDTAARLGGDEFALLLPAMASTEKAEETADRIMDAFHRPFVLQEISLEVGATIGIALSPQHGSDTTSLLRKADMAMNQAKASRSGRLTYSSESDTSSPRRLALAADLRQALCDNEIEVYFQPKARLEDGVIVGAEALVRWNHPAEGFLSPDEFIPLAEHTGMISQLTVWVLRSALTHCRRWRAAGLDLGVSVNLSVRSVLDGDLPSVITGHLMESGVPPSCLTLEITESSIMVDPARTTDILERLAAAGMRISVDDFGTGYSSLTYLQRLPVSEVKIDKSFVFNVDSDRGDAMIVQSIVELGHNLGLTVVAEGVETEIAWERLRTMGCDVAQGYLLSKPVPAPVLLDWLLDRRRDEDNGTGLPVFPLVGVGKWTAPPPALHVAS